VNFNLWRCEVERAGRHPLGFQLLCKGVQQPDALRELIVEFSAVKSSVVQDICQETSVAYGSSFRSWASPYSNAALDAITDFVKRTFTISASWVSSYQKVQ
jgi:hypothetical protein